MSRERADLHLVPLAVPPADERDTTGARRAAVS
jgi:hypothetical protein